MYWALFHQKTHAGVRVVISTRLERIRALFALGNFIIRRVTINLFIEQPPFEPKKLPQRWIVDFIQVHNSYAQAILISTLSFIVLVGCLKLSLEEIVFQSLASLSYKLPRGSLSRISLHSPSSSSSPPSPISHSPLDPMMLLRSCSLCLLFIGILLSTTSVIGRRIANDVRTGYYRESRANDPLTKGWLRKVQIRDQDIKCICFGIENANCFGLRLRAENDITSMRVLHVTGLKMRPSRPSRPDSLYFAAEKTLSLNWSALRKWELDGFTTVWDLLQDISKVQNEMGNPDFQVNSQESYIRLIKSYLIKVGIIVEKS
ncbi:hypothetical protein C8J55DRAFT_193452 [Lentinula edodes]|uniref:Uncharacterized protein n=1 Tax=Lentinula lateritia TaxID=40482 RepID=A0A9W8ZYN5_9AGAR|nr:hypothetical protein C8J55DRAFT_193452 [Lentinula edodes]